MIGLPHETHDTARDTVTFAKYLKEENLVDKISVSILVPYPGSDIFNNPKKYGINILTKNWSKYNEQGFPVIETESLSAKDIHEYYKELAMIAKE